MTTPEEGLARIHARFGAHDGHRALHAKGIHCVGTFTATPEAAELTKAAHMSGAPVPAKVRFSNGGGDPNVPDYVADVRGIAVSFQLPDGTSTDILGQTIPHFPFHDEQGFFATLVVSKPGLAALLHLPAFIARYPRAALQVAEANKVIGQRISFAAHRYFPFHAMKWVDADGGSRYVRYTWQPTVEETSLSKAEAKERGRDFLFDGLREQLANANRCAWTWRCRSLATATTRTTRPTNGPADRQRVTVGTLEVTAVDDDADDGIIFDPMRLTDGIEPSDDPVLRYRPDVYGLSYARRASS